MFDLLLDLIDYATNRHHADWQSIGGVADRPISVITLSGFYNKVDITEEKMKYVEFEVMILDRVKIGLSRVLQSIRQSRRYTIAMISPAIQVFGYHGTSRQKANTILSEGFRISDNDYDWLGEGVYFFQVVAEEL